MSAETLRKAAELIREDHPPCECGECACPTIFFDAVALLLENEANAQDAQDARESDWPDLTVNLARRGLLLSIALAYLMDPPTSLASDTNPPGSEAGEHHVTRQTGSPAG